MPTFTTEQLCNAMHNTDRIRNFSVVAQVDAGKTTLSDSLLSHTGLINKDDAGDKRATDTMKQEIERGITIKAVGVSMYAETPNMKEGEGIVINLVDSPGHVDFNGEVSASLRVTDGALVLIDTVDGVKAQTKTVLTQALAERVKPVLVINKIDKLFLSLNLQPEEIYNQFLKNVEDVNEVITTYQDPLMVERTRDQSVDPVRGDVCFATAYHTWGFTLKTFATIYNKKSSMTIEKMMEKLWERKNFCEMIIKPLYIVLKACQAHPNLADHGKDLPSVCKTLGINLKIADFELKGKELMKRVMGTWLPVANAVIDMAHDHLPSPVIAQKYRADLLYKGTHDEYYDAIYNCKKDGPLIIYISKMVPTKDNSHFYAFGRVFAGTARSRKIKVLFNEHDPLTPTKSKTYLDDSIQRVILMMGGKVESVESIPVGNTLGLDGVDKTMIKSGTIVDTDSVKCFPLKNMTFSVSPVVRYSIVPKSMGDIGKFTETLKKFVKSDPCLQYHCSKEGEHILAGAGELHLDVALEQLRTDFLKNIEFTVSEPVVSYCETIEEMSSIVCLAKSPNKHNRLYFRAEPLDNKLVDIMIKGDLPKDPKERQKLLIEDFGFGEYSRKIWSMSPESEPKNMIIDVTKGVQYMNEIKDNVVAGFLSYTEEGPLCGEPLRGVRFNIEDVVLHADTVHRGGGQIIPTVRNVIYSSILSGKPRLMEPIFMVEISVPRERVQSIYGVMSKRRGQVKTVVDTGHGNVSNVEGELPVAESFGFIEELRSATSGTAFASMTFHHWEVVPGDPLEQGTYANQVLMKIRERKGLKKELPKLEDYLDKL